jgi:ZIP family zinc transporter
MSLTLQAAIWGLVAALPLLVGAAVAIRRSPSPRVVGLVAAFGAGALISAVSFDLVLAASEKDVPRYALGVGVALGAITYWLGKRAIGRRQESGGGSSRGAALLLGAALDGIPEAFILGLSLAIGGGVSLPFLVAVVISNFPEGMAATAELRESPEFKPARLLRTWAVVVAVCAVVAGLGGLLGEKAPLEGAMSEGFAAGALLSMVTGDLVPEAEKKVGALTGLLAVLGFAVAFALHQLGE